jgi:hypothetical protein
MNSTFRMLVLATAAPLLIGSLATASEIRQPNCKIAIRADQPEVSEIAEALKEHGFDPYIVTSLYLEQTPGTMALRIAEDGVDSDGTGFYAVNISESEHNYSLARGTMTTKTAFAKFFKNAGLNCVATTERLTVPGL